MPAPKPWERAGPTTGSRGTPLGSSSADDGQPKPWETAATVIAGEASTSAPTATVARPWDRSVGSLQSAPYQSQAAASPHQALHVVPYQSPYSTAPSTSYGGAYNTASMYGGQPAHSAYGSSMYGSSLYGRPYSSAGTYGSGMYGSGVYGGGMYSGGSMYGMSGAGMYGAGGYGAGLYARPPLLGGYGSPGTLPNGPAPLGIEGHPDQAQGLTGALQTTQTRWQAFMTSMNGLMHFFGRVSFLMDENAHAVHFFITALLQLLDRASFLYGEIARFVLRLLGYKGLKRVGSSAVRADGQQLAVGVTKPAAMPVEAFESVWPGSTST